MSLAWHVAALPRGKRFPTLDKLLVGQHKRRPRRQDPKALEALLMTW